MADTRIHPGSSRDDDYYKPFNAPSPDKTIPLSSSPPPSSAPGTHTIQIFGLTPPWQQPPRPQRRRIRNCCAGCVCGFGFALIFLIAFVAALYFACSKPPKYSVDTLSAQGFNRSPTMNITLTASNPHYNNIAIYYGKGSSVTVSHSGVELCSGAFPAVFQPTKKNVTTLHAALRGSGLMRFSTTTYNALIKQQRRKQVPLGLELKVPISFEFLLIRSWRMTLEARCDIAVDKLTRNPSIVSSKCSTKNIIPWR